MERSENVLFENRKLFLNVTPIFVIKYKHDRYSALHRAQINPHFLFNTLNNIYSLAVSSGTHTAPSILKLSQMMRYITEEATENYVPLEDETGKPDFIISADSPVKSGH